MNHVEAMKAYLEGKKIRKTCWSKYHYVHLVNDKMLSDEGDEIPFFDTSADWELYEDPKPEPKFKVGDKVDVLFGRIKKECILTSLPNEYYKFHMVQLEDGRIITVDEKQISKSLDLESFFSRRLEILSEAENKKEEEWTYPCVVRSKLSKDIVLAIKDSEEDKNCFFGIYDNEISIVGVKDNWTVIATDLKNLEGV
jgi:hypothetical protein